MFSCLRRFLRPSISEEELQRVRLARLLDASAPARRRSSRIRSRAPPAPPPGRAPPPPATLRAPAASSPSRRRDALACRVDFRLPAVAVALGLGDAALDLAGFGRQRLELRAHAAAVLAEEVDLLLERLDLGIGA
jgi:hypothetical protein